MKFCPKCEAQLEEGAAFCGVCGHNLADKVKGSTSADVDASTDVVDFDDSNVPAEDTPQRFSGKKGRFFVLLVVAIAVAIGVAAFFLINPEGFDQDGDSSNGGVVLNPNVLIYDDGQSPFQILASDYYSVTVSSLDGIDDESILAAGVTDATPYGLLRKIDSIEEVSEGYRINTTPAALTDAIEECDISFVVVFTEDGDYEIVYGETEIASLFGPSIAHATSLRIEHRIDRKEDFGTFSTGVALEVSLRIHRGDITMRVVLRCFAGAELSLTRVEWERKLMQAGKPLTFFVGPLPVVLVNSVEVKAGVGAEVSALALSLDIVLDKSIGFEYSTQRGLVRVNEDNSRWPQTRLSPEQELFSATLNAKIEVIFSSRIYGLAGPELSAAVQGEASADLRKVPDGVDANGAIVVPGLDWRLSGSYREKVTVPISGRFVLRIPDFNPFSSRTRVIANIEVFNTGDAITLLDVNKEFGHPVVGSNRNSTLVANRTFDDVLGDWREFALANPETEAWDNLLQSWPHMLPVIYPDFRYSNLYYALFDFDDSGRFLLFISSSHGFIHAIYSANNGNAQYIFAEYEEHGFWERNSMTVGRNCNFIVHGSGGADSFRTSVYLLNDEGLVDKVLSLGMYGGEWRNFIDGSPSTQAEFERHFSNPGDLSELLEWRRFVDGNQRPAPR